MGSEALAPGKNGRPPAVSSDAVLVLNAQQDNDAFAPLYDRYFDSIFRFCFYRLGDWQEAEDAASDIFVKALASVARFRTDGEEQGFRSWLFTIARHVVTDRRRYQGRHPSQPIETAALVPDPANTPEEQAVVADDHQRVRHLLGHLKPDQRDLLELRLAGLKNAEIAGILGKSHDAVRKEQSRIIQTLRSLVGTQAEQGAPNA
jgi:RNA polymerase sigma-70 factor, ECF subfamily